MTKKEDITNLFSTHTQHSLKNNLNSEDEFMKSTTKLKEWCKKDTFTILYDSDIHGCINKNDFLQRVINKRNMYFIHFDYNQNIFGGYVGENVDKIGLDITDKNAFIFSLVRNGKIKNVKYKIQYQKISKAFYLYKSGNFLYDFGGGFDIKISGILKKTCWCNSISKSNAYVYHDEKYPLTDENYPKEFELQRILIIQMS
ncbi:TLDc domain-containing protein [Entamoeba marina]